MTTPVVWLAYHDHVKARGMWDQALLEALLTGDVWRPVAARGFDHASGTPAEPAVVVIGGRFHHTDADIGRLNHDLAALPAVLLVVTSDEENAFPIEKIDHPNLIPWVQTPDPDRHTDMRVLGVGWSPLTRPTMATIAPDHDRPLDWFFAGQVTHERRTACVAAVAGLDGGELVATAGFTQGLPQGDYLARLAHTKVALCPGGPITPDTFRVWESLEAGCLPIVDARAARPGRDRYWHALFDGDPPFPIVTDWASAPTRIADALDGWPANANRASAAWMARKRHLAYALQDDLDTLGAPRPAPVVDDRITVLVPTSPIPAHPSTEVIEATVASIRDQLPDAEILVMCDGVRTEQADRTGDYHEYLRRLLWLAHHRWRNVAPIVHDDHLHQAEMTRRALPLVRTPTVLFVEHDTPFVGDIWWGGLVNVILAGDANVIRLHHEASVLPEHRHLMLDDTPRVIDGLPLLRTAQWSQRPHLASTGFYRDLIDRWFPPTARTMIEDRIHGVVEGAYLDDGAAGWGRWRIFMYAPPGDMKRSTHLDGRGDDPKYGMRFQ